MRIPTSCLALVLVAGVLASDTGRALANAAYDAGMSALASTFSPRPGTPSGSYACRTISVNAHRPDDLARRDGRHARTLLGLGDQMASRSWSGSGDHLKFSGQPFNTAQAQYGANRAGRSSIRFVWNPKSQPTVWICTR